MIYSSKQMEENAVLDVAQIMCASARTAPKAKGLDNIETLVLTGDDILALADKMEEIDERNNGENRTFFTRDAKNLRVSQAVVLVGVKQFYYGLNCSYCGYSDCASCKEAGGACVFGDIDLGIAVGSAVKAASDLNVDCRVMYSAGKCAKEMPYTKEDTIYLALPLSVSGKSPYFDRN